MHHSLGKDWWWTSERCCTSRAWVPQVRWACHHATWASSQSGHALWQKGSTWNDPSSGTGWWIYMSILIDDVNMFQNQHLYCILWVKVYFNKTGHCVFIKTGMMWGKLPIWPCLGLGIITICVVHLFFWWLLPSLKFNLRRAAKERIRRMVAPKSRRKELNAPEYLKEEWEKGDKDALSELLINMNFNKDWCLRNTFLFPAIYLIPLRLHPWFDITYSLTPMTWLQETFLNEVLILVKKKKTYTLTVDEGWYSEAELKELGWTTSLSQGIILHTRPYRKQCVDGIVAYWRPNVFFISISFHCKLRAKITGAKTRCLALGDTHSRPTLHS